LSHPEDEAANLGSGALQDANSSLAARELAEQELLAAKELLRRSEEQLRAAVRHVGNSPADVRRHLGRRR